MSACQHVSMSACHHVSIQHFSMPACQQHVSMSACHHISIQHVSIPACQRVNMAACQHFSVLAWQNVSMPAFMSSYHHVSMAACQRVSIQHASMSAAQTVKIGTVLMACAVGKLTFDQRGVLHRMVTHVPASGRLPLALRVQGPGCRVPSCEFWVSDFQFRVRVCGVGFRVQSPWFRVWGLGFRVEG